MLRRLLSLNTKIICIIQIKNEKQIETYLKNLNNWENEQKRLWEEFQIDEQELERRLVSL